MVKKLVAKLLIVLSKVLRLKRLGAKARRALLREELLASTKTKARIVLAAHLSQEALSALEDVDDYGRQLAGDDPVLRHLLGGLELTLAQQLGHHVRRAPRNK